MALGPSLPLQAQHNKTMKAWQKWVVGIGLIGVAVVCLAWLAFAWWLPTDEELAQRLAAKAEVVLGVKVSIGSVQWALLPTPVITVNDFRTQQAVPIIVGKLSIYPNLRLLMRHELAADRMDISDATVPRNSLHGLHVEPGTAGQYAVAEAPLQQLHVRNLTWISYSGIANSFDGEIDFDPHWRPRHAELRRPGITPPFTLTAARDADADRWQMQIFVGGGTAHGHLALKTGEDGSAMHLTGELAPRDIEVESAISAFNRRSPISGKGTGQTVVSANGASLGELTRSLHTHTTFTVNHATVLRFDLDKAISTRGKEHNGHTPLQELTGQLDTQNGPEGMRVTGTDIRARAGKFTATGQGTLYHGQIEASGNFDLVEGALGVPFNLSGSVHKPKITVPPGFFAGAAIGTVVLPGIGTVIGARIGGALGKIFKGDAQQQPAAKNNAVRK